MTGAAGRPSPPVIGLLGGIGCGKSEVARRFAVLGAETLDADSMAHEILASAEVQPELRALFGDAVFGADGVPDRAALAALVFGPAGAPMRGALEQVLHPRVLQRISATVQASRGANAVPLIVLDVPLIAENPAVTALCDRLVFIHAPEDARRQRCLESRGWSATECAAREAAQTPLDQKRDLCRHTLNNSGTVAALHEQVDELHDGLLAAHRLASSIEEHGLRAHGGLGPAATAKHGAGFKQRGTDGA